MSIIYKITNTTNNKSYIGFSKFKLERRWQFHTYSAKSSKNPSKFHKALMESNFQNWTKEILEENVTLESCRDREKHFISLYNSFQDGYNSNEGGNGCSGHTSESIAKMVIAQTGRLCKQETKIKIGNAHRGKKHSIERRLESSILRLGQTWASKKWIVVLPNKEKLQVTNLAKFCVDNSLHRSAMTRVSKGLQKDHMGYSCVKLSKHGNPVLYSKIVPPVIVKPPKIITPETREKLRITSTGRTLSPEARQKISSRLKGKTKPVWSVQRHREFMMGKTHRELKWEILTPDDTLMIVTNLSKFCRENSLNQPDMIRVSQKRSKSHKGYRCCKAMVKTANSNSSENTK